MTYDELLRRLLKLNDEQLAMDVTVKQDYGEYIPVSEVRIVGVNEGPNFGDAVDVLDDGHPVLVCND